MTMTLSYHVDVVMPNTNFKHQLLPTSLSSFDYCVLRDLKSKTKYLCIAKCTQHAICAKQSHSLPKVNIYIWLNNLWEKPRYPSLSMPSDR